MNKSVIIRADGDKNIGLGHLVRCLSLAHMLKDEFENILFISKCITPELKEEIKLSGFNFHEIIEEAEFFALLNPYVIAVLDGYSFDLQYQRQVKTSGAKLVFIDDLHNKEFVADLIINHAPGVKEEDYIAQPFTKFCLGPEYALLRPPFLKRANENKEINKINSVFICFGGADYKNLTEAAARYVLNDQEVTEIKIIIGGANQNITQLQNLANKYSSKIDLAIGLNDTDMVNTMLSSQIAVVPASGILFEVLALKLIPVSGYYIDNQRAIYEGFKKYNAFFDAQNFNINNLDSAFRNAKTCSKEGKSKKDNIIDGLSASRIKKMFLNL